MKIMRGMLSIAALLAFHAATAQAQATVTCKDGTSSKGGQGACSAHGGVSPAKTKAVAKANAKSTKADVKASAAVAKADTKAAAAKAEAKAEKTVAKADAKVAASKADVKAAGKIAKANTKAAAEKAEAKAEKTVTKADAKVAKTTAKASGAATATCNDGTSSYAKNHAGACSGHGGVKVWLDGSAKKP
jgi:hypothetical protein